MKTDAELHRSIQQKLDCEPGVDPAKISYSIRDGVVTLNGSAGSYTEKHLLTRAVRRVDGVKAVADEVLIQPFPTKPRPSDSDVATFAVRSLEWDTTLPKDKIKVTVESGRITLTGEVPWHYQRKNAEIDVRHLSGVIAVDNQIVVKPLLRMATAAEVKEKIRQEFERHALLDAQSISIEVEGSTITLQGKVQSWAEFKEASHIAWSMPGVTQVNNQIQIVSNLA